MKSASYISSTVGRKQVMAIAGIGLCAFVLLHAAGNMFLFVGPEAYNRYSHAITANPLLYLAEGGLVVMFLAHIVSGLIVTVRNRRARPANYAVSASGEKKTSLITKTMWLQGIVLLGFVVLHLFSFKYGEVYESRVDGVLVRDLFRLVYEIFQSPIYVAWYVVALAILTFHLSHGLYSSLQTLGLNHPKYTPKLKALSVCYGLVVGVAFISQPLYMFFVYKG